MRRVRGRMIGAGLAALLCCLGSGRSLRAQEAEPGSAREKVIFDTDIGDDIDDAFALALAVSSPKLEVMGVTTAWGDTDLRARLTKRLLETTGHGDIPVTAGPKTHASSTFTQARWAQVEPEPAQGWPDATDFTLDAIRRNPGQITLIAIAPFSNVGALIDRDAATFRKLKRIVLMGGSIHRRYGDLGYSPDRGPEPEYNVVMDVASSRKLFASGVPIEMMPLDSTQLKFDEVMRDRVFSQGTRMTDALLSLYEEWHASTGNATPTLFDAMAVAAAIDPSLCPTAPMHIEIDEKGFTQPVAGEPNANVCLNSDSDQFFHFYIPAILNEASR
jgi:purine nucleosidase